MTVWLRNACVVPNDEKRKQGNKMSEAYMCDMCKDCFPGDCGDRKIYIGTSMTKREYCEVCWHIIRMRMEGPVTISV